MTWIELLALIKSRWYWLAAFAAAGLALAWFVTGRIPPQYQATATLYVSYVPDQAGDVNLYQGSLLVDSRVRSFPALVDSPAVLNPVIDQLGLDADAESLAGRITASNPEGTVLLEVTAVGSSPGMVAELANSVSSSYGQYLEQQVQVEAAREGDATTVSAPLRVSLAVPAAVPGAASWPKPRTNLLLGLMLGTGLGAVLMVSVPLEDSRPRRGPSD